MSSTCFSQSPVPLALLLTVAAAQCKENSLSLSLHQHKNKSKHQYRSKSISVAQQHIYTKQTQIATSRFPTLADELFRRLLLPQVHGRAIHANQDPKKKDSQTGTPKQREVPVVFSSPIYWLRIPRSEARSQAMCWSYAALADMYAPGSGRRQQS